MNKIIESAILLFVFLIPWQARWLLIPGELNGGYWEYGTRSLYVTEILLGVILVLVIAKFLIVGAYCRKYLNFKHFYSSPGALFLIYAGISIFWSIDKNIALEHWVVLVEAGALFLLSGCIAIRPYGNYLGVFIQKIQWTIILSAVVQVIFAVAQSHLQYIPASTELGMAAQNASNLGTSVVETATGRWLRAYGTFPHPNILGAWLVLGLISIVSLWRNKELRVTKLELRDIFLYSSFFVILFGLLLTFSRSAWLAFGVFFIFWFFSEIRKCHPALDAGSRVQCTLPWIPACAGMTIILVTVFTFVAIFPDPFFSRLRFSSNRLEIKSNSERIASWQEGIEIIKKHPLLGVGIGNYGLAVHRDIDSNQPAWYYQPAHNVFLLIWAELGFIGLLFLAYGLWLMAFRFRIFDLEFLITCLLPLFIIASLDHYLWSLYSGMMILAVWLILAKNK